MHAATFGGNPIACRAALATIETIEADGLLERAAELGGNSASDSNRSRCRCPLIREVRVKGVMIGIELNGDGTAIVRKCLDRRLLINCTQETVIRLLPALNLTDAEFEEGCAILEEALIGHSSGSE